MLLRGCRQRLWPRCELHSFCFGAGDSLFAPHSSRAAGRGRRRRSCRLSVGGPDDGGAVLALHARLPGGRGPEPLNSSPTLPQPHAKVPLACLPARPPARLLPAACTRCTTRRRGLSWSWPGSARSRGAPSSECPRCAGPGRGGPGRGNVRGRGGMGRDEEGWGLLRLASRLARGKAMLVPLAGLAGCLGPAVAAPAAAR